MQPGTGLCCHFKRKSTRLPKHISTPGLAISACQLDKAGLPQDSSTIFGRSGPELEVAVAIYDYGSASASALAE